MILSFRLHRQSDRLAGLYNRDFPLSMFGMREQLEINDWPGVQ